MGTHFRRAKPPGPTNPGSFPSLEPSLCHRPHTGLGQGTGPINAAGITQGLLTHTETRLAQEANAPAHNLVPIPRHDPSRHPARRPAAGRWPADFGRLHGGLGRRGREPAGWRLATHTAVRAPTHPREQIELRAAAERSILAAAGVPVSVLSESDGTKAREDFRRFLHSTMMPLGKLVASPT